MTDKPYLPDWMRDIALTNAPPPPPKRVTVTVHVEEADGRTMTVEYLDVQVHGEPLRWSDLGGGQHVAYPGADLTTRVVDRDDLPDPTRLRYAIDMPEPFLDLRIVGRLRTVETTDYAHGAHTIIRRTTDPEEPV